jgi:RimJ/RimL family protein N-acetyltransferase
LIIELDTSEYMKIKPLIDDLKLSNHPVINGVMDGNNLGRIFVDNREVPTVALVWARMEMFYFIGNSENDQFNRNLETFIIDHIKPDALSIGDNDFNLEVYPFEKWEQVIKNHFSVTFNKGLRVPFVFRKDLFFDYLQKPYKIHEGYEIHRIDDAIVRFDKDNIIQEEVLKFWASLEEFFKRGLGFCVIKDQMIIGTCISVFVSGNEFEIGINTYSTEHRGKGLASMMAREFIQSCIKRELIPHWTTEDFRRDSIAIAEKMGFIQLPKYNVYYIPFKKWMDKR